MAPSKESKTPEDIYYKSSTFDMQRYMEYRPPYGEKLYNEIYSHHKGGWENALDIATGPGMVARELGKKFENVIGVDFNSMYVEVATLASKDRPNVSFKQCVAEDLSQFPDNHFDLVTIGESAQWFQNKAFEEIGRVLKPQGTLAMWFYGNSHVPGDPVASKILYDTFFKFNTIFPYTEDTDAMFQRITSGLDKCKIPEEYFEPGTRRLRINYKSGTCVNPPGAYPCKTALPPSPIPQSDEIIPIEDPDFLTVTKSWDWFKGFMSVLIPMEHLDSNEVYKEEFDRLEKVLGGQQVKFSWAVSMILARKKS